MSKLRAVLIGVALAIAAAGAPACSGDDRDTRGPATAVPATADNHGFAGIIDLDPEAPDRCEFLGGGGCLLPFPSDHFTRADPSTPTGRRVAFARESMPANAQGVRIDPTEWNRNDGFSPGAAIIVKVPGIDPERTGLAPVTDIGRSLAEDAPIVLLDAASGQRWPYWAELDANASDEAERTLLIRPARNFPDGSRIVVGLRNLRRADGRAIDPPGGFRAYRDRLFTDVGPMEARRGAMEELFGLLTGAGVERGSLYLAWDFTVASTTNLTGRAIAMRDDAYRRLGDEAPRFTVTKIEENPDPTGAVMRIVEGTLEVPNYLTGDGSAGAVLNNSDDPEGIPTANGTYTASVLCVVPRAAEAQPAPAIVYGHGLLGDNRETRALGTALAATADVVVCGTPEIGMSSDDVGLIPGLLADLSAFRTMPDRLQQAMLNLQFLARVIRHPQGLRTDPAFQRTDGTSLLGSEVQYVGNSQGGILGGATSAVSTEWSRAFLGVPGMNYSTLLNRSIDFDAFGPLLGAGYPARDTQQVVLGLVQMLWDRGENNGYANHLTADPLPGTSPKQVLLFAAFGDHQVANVTTDVLARTIGARIRQPALAPGRSPDVEPFWGIEPLGPLPARGSGYVMWDFGTPAPPSTNTPNRAGEDPHGKGGTVPEVLALATTFVLRGEIVEVCGGQPCATGP